MKGLTLSRREQARVEVLNRVLEGRLGVKEAAEVMGVSERHSWRLLAAYRKEGIAALANKNRGRQPAHAIPEGIKERVRALAQGTYMGFNHCHLTEVLVEREGLHISRSSVRRILHCVGMKSPRKRRAPKHRSRRERYSQEGMLLQIDGSRHDWLEGRGPYLSLIGAIDDATGKVPHAVFRDQEDAQGYFLLLHEITSAYGIPLALYHDRHSIFEPSPRKPESLEEQLTGRRKPTQFGRALEEVGIISISALSPQAKGRIERLWGTFQDRLVSELRLAGASTRDEANRVLKDFVPRHNSRFAIAPAEQGSAYRDLGASFIPEEVFCFKYERTVGADNVVRFGEHRLQIQPSNSRLSYAHARVEVHERLDGSLAVYYQGRCLATTPAPSEAPVIRARKLTRPPTKSATQHEPATVAPRSSFPKPQYKPDPNHPWRHWVHRPPK